MDYYWDTVEKELVTETVCGDGMPPNRYIMVVANDLDFHEWTIPMRNDPRESFVFAFTEGTREAGMEYLELECRLAREGLSYADVYLPPILWKAPSRCVEAMMRRACIGGKRQQ